MRLHVNSDLISIEINIWGTEVIIQKWFFLCGVLGMAFGTRITYNFSAQFCRRHNFLEFSMEKYIYLFHFDLQNIFPLFLCYTETKRRHKNCVQEASRCHEMFKLEVSSTRDQ